MHSHQSQNGDRCSIDLEHLAWLVVVGLCLSGCQTKELAATPRSIAYLNVTADEMQAVADKAQTHCARYRRDAELIPGELADGRATFRCIDR